MSKNESPTAAPVRPATAVTDPDHTAELDLSQIAALAETDPDMAELLRMPIAFD